MSARIMAVRHNDGTALRPSPQDLPALLDDPDVTVWVDLPEHDDQALRLLRDVFKFHPLLIEDAFADATTPKLESFDDYLYIIVHGLHDKDPADGEITTTDLDLFIGKRFLITHHVIDFAAVSSVWNAVEKNPARLAKGSAVIAHQIIDRLVDEYLPLMEKLDNELDRIEEMVLSDESTALLQLIFRMKHSLQRIRRVGLHQKALLLSIANGNYSLIPEDTLPFYRDVYDHMQRVMDLTEAYRELVASSLDAYLGVQSFKLNEVMRVLTVFSTVMLPLTFITGLYGMNFEYMPYLHFQYGFEVAMLVMITVALAMLYFFRRRRWI